MITPEQVADLQPGDVVELVHDDWPEGSCWRGPIYSEPDPGWLYAAGTIVRDPDGDPRRPNGWSLTVVSRAPRPLYVNHPRRSALIGDVVRDDESDRPNWYFMDDDGWHTRQGVVLNQAAMPPRLRLLVDGETGMTVPQ